MDNDQHLLGKALHDTTIPVVDTALVDKSCKWKRDNDMIDSLFGR